MAKNEIRIYGNISEWNDNNAREVCKQIEAAQGYEVINLHLHCYGGSVFEGNLIFNAIKKSKTPIDIYIDGVAASMGAILTTAARRVYMCENAFLMVHAPANPVTAGRGTADEHIQTAKLLRSMQKNFIKAIAARTQKPEELLKNWMNGDNWFSASEALQERLIDGIVEAVAPNVITPTTEEVRSAEISHVYGLFAASLHPLTELTKTDKNSMSKDELIKRYGLTGVTAQSSDEEILTAIDAKLKTEKDARESAENKLKEQTAAQINAMLDGVNLTPTQRAKYQEIGEKAGTDVLALALEPLKKDVPTFTALLNGQRPAAAVGKTWDELDRNDGLAALKAHDPEAFRALYVEKFGKEPTTY